MPPTLTLHACVAYVRRWGHDQDEALLKAAFKYGNTSMKCTALLALQDEELGLPRLVTLDKTVKDVAAAGSEVGPAAPVYIPRTGHLVEHKFLACVDDAKLPPAGEGSAPLSIEGHQLQCVVDVHQQWQLGQSAPVAEQYLVKFTGFHADLQRWHDKEELKVCVGVVGERAANGVRMRGRGG